VSLVATAGTGNRLATTFLVDGQEYGGDRFTSAFERFAVALFTADTAAVAARLPSRELQPLRWFGRRALLWMDAWDRTLTVGDLPPVRFGQVYLLALVTYGRSAAPPVLPAAAMLPVVGDAVARRFGGGVYMLASIVTNRVAAEMGRVLLGEPSALGEIRQERRPGALRVTATDAAGETLSLEVHTGGRTQPVDMLGFAYSGRGADLLRQSNHAVGRQSMRLGRSSARLDLGHHEWAQLARDLGMSTRPTMSLTWADGSETMTHLERLGAGGLRSASPAAPDPVQAPFVIRAEDGSETVVDQQLDRLPFNPAGTFEAAAA
jgi:hypothetical protein